MNISRNLTAVLHRSRTGRAMTPAQREHFDSHFFFSVTTPLCVILRELREFVEYCERVDLKAAVAAVAAIDDEMLVASVGSSLARFVMPSVRLARRLLASSGNVMICRHPFVMASPCGSLFITKLDVDADSKKVIGVSLTCDPSKADGFSAEQVKHFGTSIKNGDGAFKGEARVFAEARVLRDTCARAAEMLGTLGVSIGDVQGDYMGTSFPHDNSALYRICRDAAE